MMLKVKKWFKKQVEICRTIDYVENHISYRLLNEQNKDFIIFDREQLRFLVVAKVANLTEKQINRIIKLAIKEAIIQNKANFLITRHHVYLALL